ncbi:helix-turn-helix domain-containing protein [Streptomyces sp. 5.8]|uniref:helix-turn-helix domain-containing protein n=1 Tax=Streptomyces sp. 5.8 TaxID=3406571 RepID=UPI003BB5FB89
MARTYIRLTEAGARTVQELCEAVGYTPRTINRHLEDLTRHGLAVCSTDGRWTAIRTPGTRAGGPMIT